MVGTDHIVTSTAISLSVTEVNSTEECGFDPNATEQVLDGFGAQNLIRTGVCDGRPVLFVVSDYIWTGEDAVMHGFADRFFDLMMNSPVDLATDADARIGPADNLRAATFLASPKSSTI